MAHHGSDAEQEKRVRRELDEIFKRSFGEFPDGRLNAQDEGEIPMSVGHQDGRVVLQFPRNLNWIGFTADQAIDLANTLIEHARSAGSKKPLTVKIG